MRKLLLFLAFAPFAILSVPVPAAAQDESAPTYRDDIVPILVSNCFRCHAPGLEAPTELLQPDFVAPWADEIYNARKDRHSLEKGTLPGHSAWINDMELSPKEVRTFVEWSKAGSPSTGPIELGAESQIETEYLQTLFDFSLPIFDEPPPPPPPPVPDIEFTPEGSGANSLGLVATDGTNEERLVLELYADTIDGLYAIAFDLVFPSELLQLESVTKGVFLSDSGSVSTNLQLAEETGRVIVSLSRVGGANGRKLGSGGVLTIEFSKVDSGQGDLLFEKNQAFGESGETRPAIDWWAGSFEIPD